MGKKKQKARGLSRNQKRELNAAARKAIDCAIQQGILDQFNVLKILKNKEALATEIILSLGYLLKPNDFANEEVASTHRYPDYFKTKDVHAQVSILRDFFPEVSGPDEKLAKRPLPAGAEGYVVIPPWDSIAPSYQSASQKIWELLWRIDRFSTFGEWVDDCFNYIYPNYTMVTMMEALAEQQGKGRMLIVPVQLGLLRRGISYCRFDEVRKPIEFGLGLYEVGIMLLTHPERFSSRNDLGMICAGNEYDEWKDGKSSSVTAIAYAVKKIWHNPLPKNSAKKEYGCASGFLMK